MKKIIYLLFILFLIAGCSTNNNSNNYQEDNYTNTTNEESLKDPILNWCQLYNPNGYDTITCIVSNPNEVDIDITYDLVYYKDGKEVARNIEFSNYNISPTHDDIIWANAEIPKNSEVDEVKMENITVTKAYNESIDAKYKYIGISDNHANFEFEFTKKPTLASIWFVLYNDNNNNEKLDKGEIVVTNMSSITNQKENTYFSTSVYNYTNYEVYYNAY